MLEVKNVNSKRLAIKRRLRQYRKDIQVSLADFLDEVRTNAEIIPNRSGSLNPYRARKKQPSTPGRLTSRTGKMQRLIKEKGNFTGLGNINYKQALSALRLQAKAIRQGKIDKEYEGTIQFKVSNLPAFVHARGSKRRGFMPRENRKTIRARFVWEYRNRKYLDPVARRKMRKLERMVQVAMKKRIGGTL